MGTIIPPHDLRIRAEQDVPPFTYRGSPIRLVATQILSRNRQNKTQTKYIYAIDSEKLIVFTTDPKFSLFNLLGLRNRSPTAKGIQDLSSDFYERFVAHPENHTDWIKMNRYDLTNPIPLKKFATGSNKPKKSK